MHQQHVDTAQFLQQHAPTPTQPANTNTNANTRTQNSRSPNPATTTTTPTQNSNTTPQEHNGEDLPSSEEEIDSRFNELEKNKFDE